MPDGGGTRPAVSSALVWFACAYAACRHDGAAEAAYVPPPDPYAAVYKEAKAVWPITGTAADLTVVSNTFGPRWKNSEYGRYDWHRGIDLPCTAGAPVYAAAAGVATIAGVTSAYSDPLVQLKHAGTDAAGNPYVYYTNYLHANESLLAVGVGDTVAAGARIGGCGKSVSGFYHVHFELREGGLFQQHCVHPLRLLPWHTQRVVPAAEVVSVTSVADAPGGVTGRFVVNATVTLPRDMLHLQRVEVSLEGAALRHATQGGRDVTPPFLDLHSTTLQYTHLSSTWPQADCPYAAAHPAGSAYNANIHTDAAAFNGAVVTPGPFSAGGGEQYVLALSLDLTAENDTLAGTAAADRCFVVTATAAALPQQVGGEAPASWAVRVGAACDATPVPGVYTASPDDAMPPGVIEPTQQSDSGDEEDFPFMPLGAAVGALFAICVGSAIYLHVSRRRAGEVKFGDSGQDGGYSPVRLEEMQNYLVTDREACL